MTGDPGTHVVVLSGRPGGTTHRAVQALAELPAEFRLIGGLAVMCRVGLPHRATVDLDAITRGLAEHENALSRLAVISSGGGQYRLHNDLDLDVIDVAPESAEELAASVIAGGVVTDLELNVVAHAWAHDHATPVDLTVVSEDGVPLVHATDRLIASIAGLVAMKTTTVPLRASQRPEKRASDLYDLARLIVTSRNLAVHVGAMPTIVGEVIRDRLDQWFVEGAGRDRTYRELRRFDDPPVDFDDVADVVASLRI